MQEQLEIPPDASSLYYYRGADELERRRPYLQGDVFEDVEIPGVDDGPGRAIILTHACTMRAGAKLRSHLLVARVKESEKVPFRTWPERHYRWQPLPELLGPGSRQHHAAYFELVGRVRSDALATRVVCLSDYGIAVLQQRFVNHLTRVVVNLPVLKRHIAPQFEEASLLEEWRILATAGMPESEWKEVVDRESDAFDKFLATVDPESGLTLREELKDPATRPRVHRNVATEIQDRFGSFGA